MYITCDQCSTIFRLDETLLKPTGSKVRCSQCRHVFMASPPEPDPVVEADPGIAAAAVGLQGEPQQDTFDQELEGIDLAELDSILENEKAMAGGDALADFSDEADADEEVEFDEADLDLDFESALEGDFDDAPAQAVVEDQPAEVADDTPVSIDDDLDLDMDFELDAGAEEENDLPVEASAAAAGDDLDLDMDFELGDEEDAVAEDVLPEDDLVLEDADLGEDVELALDDFEDALGQVDGDGEALEMADGLLADAVEPEAEVQEPVAADATEEIDLGDLDSLLDTEDDEAPVDDAVDEDLELSLADDDDVELVPEADAEATVEEPAPVVEMDDSLDDLDLTGGLDDLLDDDEPEVETEEPEDVELSLADDLDLDISDDAGVEAATESVEAPPVMEQDEDDLDLGGLDDLLEDVEEPVDAAPADEELSLDDDLELDLDLSEEPAAEADELSLDDDLELDLADDAGPEADDLSLEEDLVLDFDDEPQAEPELAVEPAGSEVDRDEFDLSDFESLLGDDEAQPEPVGDQDEDFEITDLDGLLDEADSEEAPDVEAGDLSIDDDLELSLDDELSLEVDDDAPAATEEAPAEEDDFDLSMLDSDMLDDEVEEEQEVPADDTELSLDDDMDLVLDDAPEAQATAGDTSEADLGDIEDLDFELDAEFEDKPIFKGDAAEEDEELVLEEASPDDATDEEIDLTDIEKMLEDDTIVPDVEEATERVELDLESEGAEIWSDELGDDLGLGSDDEIDLGEIEDAIDAADQEGDDDAFGDGDDDLDLDLDLEPEAVASPEEPEPLELELEMEDAPAADAGAEEEIDLSEMNLSMEEEKPTVETETIDGGDIQLEFQVDTADPDDFEFDDAETMDADKTTAATAETTGFDIEDETFSGEDTITTELVKEVTEAETTAPAKPKKVKKKGGSMKFLVVLLVLALLGGGGFFGYQHVIENNIHIPYLSDYINPEAKDPTGIMKLATSDINGKFIENEVAGRLFAVTGKVRNGYNVPRKLIRLRGKLYTKGVAAANKIEHTFAGLIIADQELSSKTMAEIKQHLSKTAGQDKAITVAPGQTVSFMVVFSELPEDLDTYDIELVSSIKAQ